MNIMKKTCFKLIVFLFSGTLLLSSCNKTYNRKGDLELRIYRINNGLKYVFLNRSNLMVKIYGVNDSLEKFYIKLTIKDSLGGFLGTYCPRILYRWYNIEDRKENYKKIKPSDSLVGYFSIPKCSIDPAEPNKIYRVSIVYFFPLNSPGNKYFLGENAISSLGDSNLKARFNLVKKEVDKCQYWVGGIESNSIMISGEALKKMAKD